MDDTLGSVVKDHEDLERVRGLGVEALLAEPPADREQSRRRRRRQAGRLRPGAAPRGRRGRPGPAGGRAARPGRRRPDRPREVYHALRCTLVSRHDDIPPFDAAFADYWEHAPVEAPPDSMDAASAQAAAADPGAPGHDEADEELLAAAVYSAAEFLRQRDFAAMTPDELRAVRGMIARLARVQPMRRSRRLEPARPRRRARPATDASWRDSDAGRSTAAGLAEAQERPPEARLPVRRVGVDGALRAGDGDVPAGDDDGRPAGGGVCLRHPADPAHAPSQPAATRRPRWRRAGAAMPDWGGGTRIGESLATYNRGAGRALTRGAVVVIVSDGWERGDLAQLDRRAGADRAGGARAGLGEPAQGP